MRIWLTLFLSLNLALPAGAESMTSDTAPPPAAPVAVPVTVDPSAAEWKAIAADVAAAAAAQLTPLKATYTLIIPAPLVPEKPPCPDNICRYTRYYEMEALKSEDIHNSSIYQMRQVKLLNEIVDSGADAANQLQVVLSLRYVDNPEERDQIAKFMGSALESALQVKLNARESIENLVTVSTTNATEWFFILVLAWKSPQIYRILRSPGKALEAVRVMRELSPAESAAYRSALAQNKSLSHIYNVLTRFGRFASGPSAQGIAASVASIAVANMVAYAERMRTPYWDALNYLRFVQANLACDIHSRAIDLVDALSQPATRKHGFRQGFPTNLRAQASALEAEAFALTDQNDMLTNMYGRDEDFIDLVNKLAAQGAIRNQPLKCLEVALPETVRILKAAANPSGQ